MRYGKFGDIPDPPEPEECNPENFGEGACYFCQNHDYCKAEYDKFVDIRQVKGEPNNAN